MPAWPVRRSAPVARLRQLAITGGSLPGKDLKDTAEELTGNQAGLIVVGEPTIERAFDKAVTGAAKVVKRDLDATTDEIASELQEALKS
jgi:hypothetical protein